MFMYINQLMIVSIYILANWITISLQATVNENCTSPSADTQCLTVQFTRSVLEGHDGPVTPAAGKAFFLLAIFSNTPNTDLLNGYEVLIDGIGCTNNINITQSASQLPAMCEAEFSVCNSTMASMTLMSNADTISEDVFYATVKIFLPGSNFQVLIRPLFGKDNIYDNLVSSGGFSSTSLSTITSTGKSSDCEVTFPVTQDDTKDEIGVIIASTLFAVILILLAIAARGYVYLTKYIFPKKNTGISRSSQQPDVELEEAGGYPGSNKLLPINS